MKNCDDIRGRLSLYLDNELQGGERTVVEAHLMECESCAAVLAKELNFLKLIRNSGPLDVASPALRERVERALASASATVPAGSRFRSKGLAAVAAALVLLLPVVIWQFARQSKKPPIGQPSSFALMAAETHLRITRGQLPLEVESASPIEISDWFTNKVDFSVKLPNYQESSGQEKLYTLEGARLVAFEDEYAAYVGYRMKSRPISLVITSNSWAKPSGGEEIASRGLKFHCSAIDGLKVITWSHRGLTYALVSNLEERGQQSCNVCHVGTKDRDVVEPLKPR